MTLFEYIMTLLTVIDESRIVTGEKDTEEIRRSDIFTAIQLHVIVMYYKDQSKTNLIKMTLSAILIRVVQKNMSTLGAVKTMFDFFESIGLLTKEEAIQLKKKIQ